MKAQQLLAERENSDFCDRYESSNITDIIEAKQRELEIIKDDLGIAEDSLGIAYDINMVLNQIRGYQISLEVLLNEFQGLQGRTEQELSNIENRLADDFSELFVSESRGETRNRLTSLLNQARRLPSSTLFDATDFVMDWFEAVWALESLEQLTNERMDQIFESRDEVLARIESLEAQLTRACFKS
jgi:hypothetical protein